ncbi:AraC-like DNA-binding protein [Mesobacillus foraminis]|uniref:AraC-like DNA-binding protein n=3 Tax=Mesobacillus foraminis TaxID=279826 RepID=A0A4R2B3J9_9BACI|nr:AraC-like DNA-binding protein [Mesobacillus foraminis]
MIQNRTFWGKYLTNTQLDLSIASYTKVPLTWGEDSYIPEFNKLYFIMEGEGFVRVNDKTYYPKPGELYLLPSGTVQAYGTISGNTFGKYWCHFTSKLNDSQLFDLIKTPVFLKTHNQEQLKSKFEQLIFYSEKEDISSGFRVHAILLDFIAEFIEKSGTVNLNTRTVPSYDKMDDIVQYIEENLDAPLCVDDLASIANFHPNYFISVFKKYTGLSPIQFINRQRMERAKHLLITTDYSVSTIAESLGFDLSYFSRMFRVHIGFSPTNYRDMVSMSALSKYGE